MEASTIMAVKKALIALANMMGSSLSLADDHYMEMAPVHHWPLELLSAMQPRTMPISLRCKAPTSRARSTPGGSPESANRPQAGIRSCDA